MRRKTRRRSKACDGRSEKNPNNQFFATSRLVLGADFGMSVPIGVNEDGQEGDTLYMPKEILEDGSLKHPSADIFSLGLTLYELAAEPTFNLPSEGEAWHEIRNGKMSTFPKNRSPELVQMVRSMISPDAKTRITAEAVGQCASEQQQRHGNSEFLSEFLNDVKVLEEQKERQISATFRAARNKRFTPTNGILNAGGGGEEAMEYQGKGSSRPPQHTTTTDSSEHKNKTAQKWRVVTILYIPQKKKKKIYFPKKNIIFTIFRSTTLTTPTKRGCVVALKSFNCVGSVLLRKFNITLVTYGFLPVMFAEMTKSSAPLPGSHCEITARDS